MNASKIRLLKTATISLLPLAIAVGCASNGAKVSSIETETDQIVVAEAGEVQVSEVQASDDLASDTQIHETSTHGSLTLETITYENEVMASVPGDTVAGTDSEESVSEVVVVDEAGDSELQTAEATQDGFMKVNLGEPESRLIAEPQKARFNFAANEYEVSDTDVEMLQQHAAYLMSNPGLRLVVEAHSDAQGSSLNNFKLSGKRAQHIVDILVGHGVPRDLITVNNYGESFPLKDETNWNENRRVELKYENAPKQEDILASSN